MFRSYILVVTMLLFCIVVACKQQVHNKKTTTDNTKIAEQNITRHYGDCADDSTCKCPAQFELSDSPRLTHIKDQFYKSETGHLYEKTIGLRNVKGQLTEVEYFNGYFCQEVDPMSFEPLHGWYAKDKNNVYYYRPVSGGMQVSKLNGADPKSFKLLAGHYKYGMDKKFFYDETQIIEGFNPTKTKQLFNNKGEVTAIVGNNKRFKLDMD
ncbi:DKNYY domain-containing protein [Pinibacter aurantiacus]|uniref:DKNYY domain-containing protein n=1 Tax=Pinibacter aurantiacus TaxID=2851599 RepID=A0A9E2W483_9BACT|nr:DKNYY domain-containing protein [Pinibacter aurantiacus]MBV4357589.1 DKNYY domain-containing protein [Pinibacter aurantiacus]